MSNLLKQAIADAKAVRATALSNAKAALEEHFAPRLQSMLSEKLKAEVAAEEGAEEAPLPVADAPVGEETPEAPAAPEGDDVSIDVDAAPADEFGTEAPVGAESPEAPVDGAAPVEEPAPLPPEEEQPVDEMTDAMGHVDPTHLHAGLAEGEKASSDYKKKTSGHKTDNKGLEVEKAVSMKTPSEGGSDSAVRKAVEKWPGQSPIKADAKGGPVKNHSNKAPKTDNKGLEVEKAVSMSTPGGALKENDEVDEASLDEILKELEQSVHEVGMEEEGMGHEAAAPVSGDEEIDLNELLSETDEKDEEKSEEKDEEKSDKPAWLKENISLKKELQEYRSTVVYLRDRINEVNLLNAKLLYTNKLFKQANLTNEQKLKVIEQFDLTKSVREAKMTYVNLAETLNFGGKKPVVESAKKPVSATVRSITEGLASKPVASTKPTKTAVLTEGAEMANRFKKLAGIRQ